MTTDALLLHPLAIVLGACLGSFINVVVYRLPAGISLLYPPSRCPQCHTRLAPHDNIPIFGWLFLQGKCRYCHTPIAWRYPVVEALMAFLTWRIAVHFVAETTTIGVVLLVALVGWLVSLALIDLDTETLPNALTQSGLVLGIGYQVVTSSSGAEAAQKLLGAAGGMVFGVWFLSILGLVMTGLLGKEALGGGDPKLAALIGAWLGWQSVLLTLLLASCGGLIVAGIGTLVGRSVQRLRFGPFLAGGGILVLFFGKLLTQKYLLWFDIL